MNILKSIIRYTALTAVMTATALPVAAQNGGAQNNAAQSAAPADNSTLPPVVVHAAIDSTAVQMGGRTAINIEVIKNDHPGVLVDFPDLSRFNNPNEVPSLGGVEIRSLTVDSAKVGNGRIQLNYRMVIQPFDPGIQSFAPFRYATPGQDTAASDQLTFKVLEVPMPKEMYDSVNQVYMLNPLEKTVSVESRWYDIIPDQWPWFLVGLGVLAIIIAILLLYKKNGPSLLPHKKVIPPYQLATQRLNRLKESHLAESGHFKAYYIELTDILRQYLEGRFGIYAREMTSPQIVDAMQHNTQTEPFADDMHQMLGTADFVKFAKQEPQVTEMNHAFSLVRNFVESTRPVEENGRKAAPGKKTNSKIHKTARTGKRGKRKR